MWSNFRSAFVLRPLIISLCDFFLVPDRCWAQVLPDNSLPFLQSSGNLLEGILLSLIFFSIAIAMPLCSFLIESEEKAYFSISLTALCAGVYSFSATGFGSFLLTLPILWNYLSMISLFLIPVELCKFLNAFSPQASAKFHLHYIQKGYTIFALLSLIGVTTGLVVMTIPFKIFFLSLLFTYTVFFFILLNCVQIGKENAKIIISGLLIFLASCLLSSLNKMFGDLFSLELPIIWGLLGLIISFILSLKNNIIKTYLAPINKSPTLESEDTLLDDSDKKQYGQAGSLNLDRSLPSKTAFLSFIHEISTPLGTGILTTTHLEKEVEELYELFRSDELKKSDLEIHLLSYKESATIISTNLQNAVNILQDFKMDVKAESPLPKQTFNVKQYIEQLLIALKPRINQAGHQIHFSCPDHLIITSYPSMFSQIIANLIMNSVTHGYPGGKNGNLNLEIDLVNDSLHLKYSDDGKGIEKKLLTKLFEPYFTTNKSAGNSGLGLFIVYTLVTERLGGSIECHSVPGKMTTFFIQVNIERR